MTVRHNNKVTNTFSYVQPDINNDDTNDGQRWEQRQKTACTQSDPLLCHRTFFSPKHNEQIDTFTDVRRPKKLHMNGVTVKEEGKGVRYPMQTTEN